MHTIAFIGLGNMGAPMARNLTANGHGVNGFDISREAAARFAAGGSHVAGSIGEALRGADAVITMLPAGEAVSQAYLAPGGILDGAPDDALLIDSSTIDVETARSVAAAAVKKGFAMVDAPVSGGVAGAEAANLTFMVGGSDEAFSRARPLLEQMGRSIVHAGQAGSGQAAKICNNMILGVSMIAVSEAFALADALGLERQKLFDIVSKSSGQCWSMTSYCPVPGPVPGSPANRGYKPGFTAAMMLKDLSLAQQAAEATQTAAPLGDRAVQIFEKFCNEGRAGQDFSGIFVGLQEKRS